MSSLFYTAACKKQYKSEKILRDADVYQLNSIPTVYFTNQRSWVSFTCASVWYYLRVQDQARMDGELSAIQRNRDVERSKLVGALQNGRSTLVPHHQTTDHCSPCTCPSTRRQTVSGCPNTRVLCVAVEANTSTLVKELLEISERSRHTEELVEQMEKDRWD